MTKKSYNRLQSDAAKAAEADTNSLQNSFWTDLENIYSAQLGALNNAANQIRILYAAEGLKEEMAKSNCAEISTAVRGLANDYRSLLASLNEIHVKHKDMDKSKKSDEDSVFAVQLGEEYEQWRCNFLAAVMPNVEYLIAEINMVLNRVRRQNTLAGLNIVNKELTESESA